MTTTFTEEQMKAIATWAATQKHDPASLTLTAPALHGPFQGNANQFGIFSDPQTRPTRWSTLARPPRGIYGLTQLRRSEYVKERIEIMSGVTAASGTNATNWCGNPPTVGQGKVAAIDYNWGEFFIKTNLNALPLIGQIRRGEVPGEILNAAPQDRSPLIPSLMYELQDPRSTLAYELWLIGVHTERSLDRVGVQGDNTLASANTEVGFIKEPDGIDRLVKTGYTDAATGLAVPAADSAVLAFNAQISGTIGGGDGRNFVIAMSDLIYGLRERAAAFGMEDTQFAVVMRREAFRAAVENWACNYATYSCLAGTAGQPFVNDVQTTNALRIEMMNGQYLLVDGVATPVVFSEGIVQESQGNGQFMSDMFILPVSWNGIPLLVTEYFPMDNQYLMDYAGFVNADAYKTLNDGLWAVTERSAGFCEEYLFGARFRLILETPFLAGRLDNVIYTSRAPIRNADPSDTFFYANGGRTYNP